MELLGRELGTHWVDFGNVEPNPNRTMPWSGRRLLSTRLPTRAQWYHWSHFDPKPPFTTTVTYERDGWEAEIQPDGVADDLGRKPIAGEAGASRCRHPIRLLTPVR